MIIIKKDKGSVKFVYMYFNPNLANLSPNLAILTPSMSMSANLIWSPNCPI